MKHAFLVMAHANFPLVGRLLKKLDHPDNTIYLHIDAKSAFSDEDLKMLRDCCRFSKLHLTPRHTVTWGGYSQIDCDLRLLEAAVKGDHDYYHFISGVDFPTKPMSAIHAFFEKYKGCEFVHFCTDEFTERNRFRHSLYHIFQEKCGRDLKSPYYFLERVSLALQSRIFKVDRSKKFKDTVYKSGSCWYSMTHACAKYLLSKEDAIKKMFSSSYCCDEYFIQTILYNSPFKENLYCEKYPIDSDQACLRSIDWEREGAAIGSPYTFDVDDYEELVRSPNLFCRKVTDQTPKGEELIKKLELL